MDEAKWIKKHLDSGQVPGLVNIASGEEMEYHIRNFLNFTHVQKLDVSIVFDCLLLSVFVFFVFLLITFFCHLQLPYIAMYRKEDIFSLLKDPETGEDASHDKPALKWHKVFIVSYLNVIS